MWHIIAIGYLFVTVLFAAAQPSIARALIYLLFWSVMPCLFAFWTAKTRRRNKSMKMQEDKAENGAD
ncbi:MULTISPECIES: hypothetical protein [unclassified Neisseria]|uniref:hypothetical protein n=1 Tax=unclassified Neisseria TaxID=2623750 RepID=UPI001071D75A|nr:MULTISPECIES: hypothetical protein [unclassified Neisseria]MBF0803134.1 hypothetical protein [Neisseria sp. 19428wB4_WF04]TFU44256.1 hypothetical protein E4T99_01975 [Neisseria sp. WF04]